MRPALQGDVNALMRYMSEVDDLLRCRKGIVREVNSSKQRE